MRIPLMPCGVSTPCRSAEEVPAERVDSRRLSTSTRSSLPWNRPDIASLVSAREKSPKPYAIAPCSRKYGASVNPTMRRGSGFAPGYDALP